MFRSRTARTFLTLGLMAGVMYLLVSLFLPASRRLIFGVDKRTGEVRRVESRVTFLPPHQFYQLSFEKRGGAAQTDGLIRINSKEGVPVTIGYRLRFDVVADQLPDARRLVSNGWNAWIRARVAEAVSAVTRQVPIEDLLSPSSQFNAQRDALRRTVARHLARSGLNVTAFEISRVEPDRDALLRVKRAELRRAARGIAGRVAIIAVDGADWDLLTELSFDERIPNMKALIRGGTTASLQTLQPTVSPLVWTSVATGVSPDRHAVIDFFDRARNAPVDAYTRRATALWEIAEAFGRHSVVTNWWTAWPPTSRDTSVFDTPVILNPSAVYPEKLAPRVQSLIVPVETVGSQQVRRFLNITNAEYENAINRGAPTDPINIFRGALAKTWSDHRVALQLYSEQKPLVMMMSYDATDTVNHLFAPYHPPYREGMSQENYRKYWPAVANFYSEVDRLIGEWMNVLTEDTTVIIVSAHGFRWGKNRPRAQPVGRAAISDHRNPGVFIAYGNHVAPSRAGHSMSLYDVVPSALALLGLPPSAEMQGAVPSWLFRDISPVQAVRVVSYSEFMGDRPIGSRPAVDPKQYQQSLQAIGHLIDPSRNLSPVLEDEEAPLTTASQPLPTEQFGAYAYYNNHGVELRKQGKLEEAVDAFQLAIDRNPNRPTPYLNMAMTMFDRQQYTAADALFIEAVKRGLPNADQWFVDFAALYREKDMATRAIALLYKGKELFPTSYLIAANLGSALAQVDRFAEGLPELERALSLQPSSTVALNNIGTFFAKKKDYGRALDFWNRSLTINPRQPKIREAANAARSML